MCTYSAVHSDSMCLMFSVASEAPRGPAGGVSVPVPALVGIPRCSRLQEGFPQPAGSSAQVAEGVWRRTHCCPLPVSNLLAICIMYCKLKEETRQKYIQSLSEKVLDGELVLSKSGI